MDILNALLGFQVGIWGYVYLNFFLGILLSYLTARVCVFLISRYIVRLKGMGFLSQYFSKVRFSRSLTLVFLGWTWLVGFKLLGIALPPISQVSLIAKSLTYLGFTLMIWQSADLVRGVLIQAIAKKNAKLDALLAPLVTRIVRILAVVFGALSLAEILHLPIASLLTGLGIGGVALAMAAKETLSNIFGSMAILTDRPFQIGDWVKVGNVEGTVEEFGMRSTRVKTFHDSVALIPNSTLLSTAVDNYGPRSLRRFVTTFNFSFETSADQVSTFCSRLTDLFKEEDAISEDSRVLVVELSPTTGIVVQVTVHLKIDHSSEEAQLRHRFLLKTHQLVDALKINWFKLRA